MNSIRFTDASEVPLVGGVVCLDFVNTTGLRESDEARERLVSYTDFLVWACRVSLLDHRGRVGRTRAVKQAASAGARELRNVIVARECFYRLFRCSLERETPHAGDVESLRSWNARALRRRTIVRRGGRFSLGWQNRGELLSPLWPIVESAVGLLVSPRLEQLRQCGECDWLFLDESKNASRRWCKKTCGDRVKARRYYERAKAIRAEDSQTRRSRLASGGVIPESEKRRAQGPAVRK